MSLGSLSLVRSRSVGGGRRSRLVRVAAVVGASAVLVAQTQPASGQPSPTGGHAGRVHGPAQADARTEPRTPLTTKARKAFADRVGHNGIRAHAASGRPGAHVQPHHLVRTPSRVHARPTELHAVVHRAVGFDARTSVEDPTLDTASTIVYRNADGSRTEHVYPRAVNEPAGHRRWQRRPGALTPSVTGPAAARTHATVQPQADTIGQLNQTGATYTDYGGKNHYGNHALYVGQGPDGTTYRSFVQFGVSSSTPTVGNAYVLNASIALDTEYSGSCTAAQTVDVAPITQAWNPKTLTDYPGPRTLPRIGTASWYAGVNCSAAPRARHLITLAPATITKWLHGPASQDFGVALSAPATAAAYKEFDADDTYLDITYTASGDGAAYAETTYASPWNNKTGWGKVTVRNEGSSNWGSTYKLGYEIYDVTSSARTLHSQSNYPTALPRVMGPSDVATVTATLPALTPPATGHSWEVCWDMLDGSTTFSSQKIPPTCYALPVVNNAPVITSLAPANNATIYSTTPTLVVSSYDPDAYPAKPFTYTYNLYSAATNKAIETVSGSASSLYTVPPGVLTYGGVYYWTVSVSDTVTASATSSPDYFSVPSPAQPLITAHLGAAPYDSTVHGIEPAVGDYSTVATDATVPGSGVGGPAVAVTRTYNSLDPHATDAFGAGWATMLDMRATPDSDGSGNIVITLADGREERFGKNTNGTFSAPQGVKAQLVPYPVGSTTPTGFQLTDAQHLQYVFTEAATDPLSGQAYYGLDSISDHGTTRFITLQWASTTVAGLAGPVPLPVAMFGPGVTHPRLVFSWGSQSVTTTTGSVQLPHVASVSYALNPGQTADANTPKDTWTYSYNGSNQLAGVCSPVTPDKCTAYSYTSGSASGSHFAAMVNDSNPTDYWRLNDPAGSATAGDSVAANENSTAAVPHSVTFGGDGHLAGSPATTASLNGTSSYLDLPQNVVSGANLSVGLWFRTTGAGETLFGYANQTPSSATLATRYVPALYIGADGKLRGQFWDGTVSPITTGSAVNDGQWHYAVLSVAGGTTTNAQSLFLDGRPAGTRAGTAAVNAVGPDAAVGAGRETSWPSPSTTDPDHAFFTGSVSDVWFAQHPTGLPAVQQEYGAAITPASELTGVTLPSGKTAVGLTYDAMADRATSVSDGDGGTWSLPVPTTTGSSDYYRGRMASTRPDLGYALNEQSGPVALDSLGVDRGSDGSDDAAYNNVTLGEPGIFGDDGDTSAGFDGKSSYVQLPSLLPLGNETASIAVWFKTRTAGGTLISEQDAPIGSTPTNYHNALLYVGTDGKLHSDGFPSYPTSSPEDGTTVVNDGQWHQATFVVDLAQDVEQIWVDGKLDKSEIPYSPEAYGPTYAFIGAGYTSSDDKTSAYATNPQGYFNGSIGYVGLYAHNINDAAPGATQALYSARGASTALTPTTKLTVTDPAGNTVRYAFDPASGNRLMSQTDQRGGVTSYSYDNRGFQDSVTDPDGHTVEYGHDGVGNVTTKVTCQSVTYCQKSTWTYEPSSSATDYAAGKQLSYSDPRTYKQNLITVGTSTEAGHVATYTYNAAGLLATDTEPATPEATKGRVTSYAYTTTSTPTADGATGVGNQLLSTTDPRGAVTKYTYYSGGQLATATSPLGAVTSYGWDQDVYGVASQTITTSSNPSGARTTYTYDADNRPLTVTGPVTRGGVDGAQHQLRTSYTYDEDGDVTSVAQSDVVGTDATRTTTYTYTGGDRVASVTDPRGKTTTERYDTSGNLVGQTRPDGTATTMTYSPTNQLLTTTLDGFIGDPTSPSDAQDLLLDSRGYDAAGLLTSDTDSMGRTRTFHYLDDNQLSYTISGSGTPEAQATEYAYDAAGNRTYEYSGCSPTTGACARITCSLFDNANRPTRIEQFTSDAHTGCTSAAYFTGQTDREVDHTYDPDGNVLTTTVANGTDSADANENPTHPLSDQHVTTNTYDAVGDVLTSVVQNGSTSLTTKHAYDTGGQLTATTDPNGNTSSITYDAAGRAVTQAQAAITVLPAGTSMRPTSAVDYDTFGEQSAVQDPDGNVTSTVHDADGNVTTVTGAAYIPPDSATSITPTEHITYDDLNRPVSSTDAVGGVTSSTYDQLGDVVRTVAPGGATTHQSYDTDREPLITTSATGAQQEATYNALGQQVTSTTDERYPSAAAYTTTTAYDLNGDVTSETDPLGHTTSFGYDRVGNRVTTTQPTGEVTSVAYNSLSEPTVVTAPDKTQAVTGYDQAGRATSTKQLSSTGTTLATTTTALDANGNATSQTAAQGDVTTYTYDADNNRSTSKTADGAGHTVATSFGYDPEGNRTSYTDPNGATTSYTYNSLGLEESQIEPVVAGDTALADRATTVAYDGDGRTTSVTQPGNVVVTDTYDDAGSLATQTGTGAEAATGARSYSYDADGRVTKAVTPSATDQFTYDDRGLILSSTDGGGTAGFGYDADDNLVSRTDAAGTATLTYDADNRLSTQAGPIAGESQKFSYTNTGQPAATVYDGVATSTDTYNGLHQLTDQKVTNPAKALLVDYTYGYNAAGQITSAGRTCATTCTTSNTYTYDGAGRLASSASGSTTTKYGYDLDGNLTSSTNWSATYDARDQLVSSTSGAASTSYSYSLRGTPTTATTGGTSTSTAYDAYDQQASTGPRSYGYDALGRLATATGGGQSATFGYDGMGTEPVTDGTNTYGWTGDGRLAGVTTPSRTVDTVQNQHGDVVASLSSSGVAGLTNYAPNGSPSSSGTVPSIGFQGQWTDPVTGQVAAGSRWYSPSLSRFASADSAQNDPDPAVAANRFAYGNDDPLDLSDPSGHDACRDYEEKKIEEAKERAEEQRERERQLREDREEQAEAEEEAESEQARENAENEAEERSERENAEEEREQEWADEEEPNESVYESQAEIHEDYEEYQRAERWVRKHPRQAERIRKAEEAEEAAEDDEGFFDEFLDDFGEVLGDAAEFVAEDPEILLVLEAGPGPSLSACGSTGEPDEVSPDAKAEAQQARARVKDAVDHPDEAPAEDPAAKAASESKPYEPTETTDDTTADTSSQAGGDEPPTDESPGDESDSPECEPAPGDAKGGVYSLRDPETNGIMRTGRTNNFNVRRSAHANDPELRGLDFQREFATDVYAEQRGLEQMLFMANPQADLVNGGFNKIQPLRINHPRYDEYMQAAEDYLNPPEVC